MKTIKVSDKQKLAQKRNWFKYVITGLFKPVDYNSLTEWEQEKWSTILNIRNELLSKFETNSISKGLKVPEHRCWCGKEGKYKPEYETFDEVEFVCKKHIKNE
jgi:hypothetical protein